MCNSILANDLEDNSFLIQMLCQRKCTKIICIYIFLHIKAKYPFNIKYTILKIICFQVKDCHIICLFNLKVEYSDKCCVILSSCHEFEGKLISSDMRLLQCQQEWVPCGEHLAPDRLVFYVFCGFLAGWEAIGTDRTITVDKKLTLVFSTKMNLSHFFLRKYNYIT